METVILVVIGIAALVLIIWRLVKSRRNSSCECGYSRQAGTQCSSCPTQKHSNDV